MMFYAHTHDFVYTLKHQRHKKCNEFQLNPKKAALLAYHNAANESEWMCALCG